MSKLLQLFCIVLLIQGLPAPAQTVKSEKHDFRVVTLVRGLQNPWALAFLPDGRMLVTEREGRLRVIGKDWRLDPRPVEGLPEIVEAYHITGDGDFLLKMYCPSITDYQSFIVEKLSKIEGVGHIQSKVVLSQLKKAMSLPIDDDLLNGKTKP